MLFKKMLRDIAKHKAQFISIFLMAFLGVFVFAGVGGESVGLEVNSNNFYEDTNLADGWIYSANISDLFLDQIDCLGATTQMERQVVVDSVGDFDNDPDITLHFVENNTISKFHLIEGKELDINDGGGVWLDKSFADAKGLKVGDNITFEFENYTIEKEIKGIGYSPEYVYHASSSSIIPDFNKIGFAYLSHKAFPADAVPYNVLNIKFDGNPESYDELLDYHMGDDNKANQIKLFSEQLEIAQQYDLPVAIHTRDAEDDTAQILTNKNYGVLHCFTSSWNLAKIMLDRGFYFSASGIITFRNAQDIRDTFAKIPNDRIVIETDSPYCAPVPYRGKPCEPAFVVETAKMLAEIKHLQLDELESILMENTMRLYPKTKNIIK